ncbi:hypothetical protein F443_09289 [Phytophthora nicotianae P1569]|uniref:Uncharacterized protein n=2 Tax=Phytophthora nicotianae TaxID=4792 RepID=V9F6B7_PHYNI|nr:hypothetical protein F443_09289 [Phytophthora nicotianae P1569]ETO74994.1 hypothetical protein F444_09374 [Phytophthora nicotianae P1976]
MILHAFVSSRGFLRARTKEQKAKRRHAYDTVVEKTFVKQLEKAIKLLEVISKFEKRLRRTPSLHPTFTTCSSLYQKSIASWRCRSPKIQQILDKRFNFIYGYAHGVGYVLDPRYLGKGMDDETRGSVKYFVGM